MSELIGKAGKKLFAQHLEKYAPEDPLYEFYTNDHGKQKRRKRQLPPGLSARDTGILRSVQKRAHYLDKGFSLCGMRFGWTFLIGLVPVAGDVANASLNYLLVVRKARKADLPRWLVARMLFNNAVSAGVGLVPFVGDVFLAVYKANSRNAALLDEFLRIRGHAILMMHEAGEKGDQETSGSATADIEHLKPGSSMTSSEGDMIADDYSKDSNTPLASSSGVASTYAKSGPFAMCTKEQLTQISKSGPKGRFVENIEF